MSTATSSANNPAQGRLGELLVREKLISLTQLRAAQEEQRKTGTQLNQVLTKLGYLSDDDIANFLATQYGIAVVDLTAVEFDPDILKLVPKDVCEKQKIIPVGKSGSSLVVAMADPTNLHAIDDIKFLTGMIIEPRVASESAIKTAIETAYTATSNYDEMLAEFGDENVELS
ncbi:MAG TPA: type II secretion system protein GspE, partial [Polyangium sp.]|nr:type II secretion system protein GspE [Polyangium sp.]